VVADLATGRFEASPGRQMQIVLIVNARSFLPVPLPAKPAATIVGRFGPALAEMLERLGVEALRLAGAPYSPIRMERPRDVAVASSRN
jgi:hypothetical protein